MEYCPHCMSPTVGGDFCSSCGKQVHWKAPNTQLAVGTLLQGSNSHVFQVGAAKGQGGFGITYAAIDLMNNQRVAIKEYYPTRCATRDHVNHVIPTTGQQEAFQGGMRSFLEEARMLSSVGALPSVVSVRDYFEGNGTAYLVMEYVEGIPLHEVVARQGRMPKEQLMPMLKELLRDLGILHRAGVIHRDISPDNLILTPQGTLKLLDFGSARSTENGKSMTVMLKAGFSPVEQYQSKGQGPYTDVYALAGTIYYCLTGRIPPTAIDRISEDELQSPNQFGAGLTPRQEEALLWGLTLIPDARPQNMDAFANALFYDTTGMGTTYTGTIHTGTTHTGNTYTGATHTGTTHTGNTHTGNTHTGTTHTGTGGGRKKKGLLMGIIGGAVAVAAAVLILVLTVFSGGTTDSGYQYRFSGDEACIVGYEGSARELVIPGSIEDRPVTTIREEAFAGKRSITSVILPGSVTTVETGAFKNCTSLELVRLGANRVNVAGGAFDGCGALRCVFIQSEAGAEQLEDGPALRNMEDVAVCHAGQSFLGGTVEDVYISQGVAYALTDNSLAVLLLLPEDTAESDIPGDIQGRRVFSSEGERIGAVVGTTEDGFAYEEYNGRIILTGYTGDETILSVPQEINGKGVKEIASGAFAGNTVIESFFLTKDVERIQPGAFTGCVNLRDLYAYGEVTVPAGAFEGCRSLRCLVVKNAGADNWVLPESCIVFHGSTETGAGLVKYVNVEDNGIVYGITDRDEAVVLDIPAGMKEVTISENSYQYPVTWLYSGALDRAEADIRIHMASGMGFPYALYDRAEWDFYEFGDFSHSWLLSCRVCQGVNSSRLSTEPKMYPEREIVEIAMLRAKELNTSDSHTRPNGQKWHTLLDDYGVDWYTGRAFKDILYTADDDAYDQAFSALIADLEDTYIAPTDKGMYFVGFGSAMYHNEGRGAVYSNSIGVTRE